MVLSAGEGGKPLGSLEYEKREKLPSVPHTGVDEDSERFERFLKRLSESDLKALTDFLIEQDEDKPSYGAGDDEVKNSSDKDDIPLGNDFQTFTYK